MSVENHKPWCSERARKQNGECICNHDNGAFVAPDSSVVIALNLMRLLDWENPSGRIRDEYIPGWMRDECDSAIRLVPMKELRAEYGRNLERFPVGMIDRWHNANR